MQIKLNAPETDAIAAFVNTNPHATSAHQPQWLKILQLAMNHLPLTLTAWRDNQIVGYLPMVQTQSIFFGRHLVSLPYVNEAGILADEPETALALIDHAYSLGTKHRARFVELRNRTNIQHDCLTPVRRDKQKMILELPDNHETLWNSLRSKVRNQIRKARKNNLRIRWGSHELLNNFYHIFATNMRDLGSPAFPKQLFNAILNHLGSNAELCIVDLDSRPVAGAILTHFKNVSEVPSASCLRAGNPACANMFMYWNLLCRSIARGSTTFDFGRSTIDTGTYRFKQQWGAIAHNTNWQHIQLADNAAPITKDDQRFKLAVKTWQYLPVWTTRLISPAIVRGIP